MKFLVQFALQLLGWVLLSFGGASWYMLARDGHAPAMHSVPVAILLTFIGIGLIWLTRKSLLKKQYRDF